MKTVFQNIYLPEGLPCGEALGAQYYRLRDWKRVGDVKRVLLLNLMPKKADTEADICRTLALTGEAVQVVPIKIAGQTYKNTPMAHMEAFYLNFDEVEGERFDRLIVTGAPLEQMPFEAVRYWQQLCHIMHWADTHTERTLYLCWAAQAALYQFYGIEKRPLAQKMFGIFPQSLAANSDLLSSACKNITQGFAETFRMPQSRHTEVTLTDVRQARAKGLCLLAESTESGAGLMASADARRMFITGHPEYRPTTLDEEYHRDLAKGLPIQPPLYYYRSDEKIDFSWQEDAVRLYGNFLKN